jgi:hypothetical protein
MAKKYERKTDRQKWSLEAMAKAVEELKSKRMGLKKAAAQFNVPRSTLKRYRDKNLNVDVVVIDKSAGKFACVFSKEQEEELQLNFVLTFCFHFRAIPIERKYWNRRKIELRE